MTEPTAKFFWHTEMPDRAEKENDMAWKLTDGTRESLPKKDCSMLVRLDLETGLPQAALAEAFDRQGNDFENVFGDSPVSGDSIVEFIAETSEIVLGFSWGSGDDWGHMVAKLSLLSPGIPYFVVPELPKALHGLIGSNF
jgi:hypothetical protein